MDSIKDERYKSVPVKTEKSNQEFFADLVSSSETGKFLAKTAKYSQSYQSQSDRFLEDYDLEDYDDTESLPDPDTDHDEAVRGCFGLEKPQLSNPRRPASSPRVPDTPTRSRFLAVPRLAEVLPSRAIVPQDQRPHDQGKLSKLRESATSSLANVFNLIPLDDAAGQIFNTYNLLMRVREFSRRLQQYDMGEVFTIMQFVNDSSTTPLPGTIDLLE